MIGERDDNEGVCPNPLTPEEKDPHEELRWDLLAFATAEEVTEERAREQEIPGGRLSLYPSLHLNLAEDYVRIDKLDLARRHYNAGLKHLHLLGDDAYGRNLRAAFASYATAHPNHA